MASEKGWVGDGTSVTATQSLDQTAGALGVGVSGALAGGVSVAVITGESEVVARMDGTIDEVFVKGGQTVKAGELLLTIK